MEFNIKTVNFNLFSFSSQETSSNKSNAFGFLGCCILDPFLGLISGIFNTISWLFSSPPTPQPERYSKKPPAQKKPTTVKVDKLANPKKRNRKKLSHTSSSKKSHSSSSSSRSTNFSKSNTFQSITASTESEPTRSCRSLSPPVERPLSPEFFEKTSHKTPTREKTVQDRTDAIKVGEDELKAWVENAQNCTESIATKVKEFEENQFDESYLDELKEWGKDLYKHSLFPSGKCSVEFADKYLEFENSLLIGRLKNLNKTMENRAKDLQHTPPVSKNKKVWATKYLDSIDIELDKFEEILSNVDQERHSCEQQKTKYQSAFEKVMVEFDRVTKNILSSKLEKTKVKLKSKTTNYAQGSNPAVEFNNRWRAKNKTQMTPALREQFKHERKEVPKPFWGIIRPVAIKLGITN